MRRRLPKTLIGDEAGRLLAAIRKPHHKLIASMGLYLGLRISEILDRRVEDFDFDRCICRVWHGKGDKDRAVPIPAKLLPELLAWCAGRTGWLFPSHSRTGRLGPRSVQRMIRSAARRAGITRKVTPHVWRHTCASQLLRSGADIIEVRDILGHSSVATTQVYLSSDPARLKSAMDRLSW